MKVMCMLLLLMTGCMPSVMHLKTDKGVDAIVVECRDTLRCMQVAGTVFPNGYEVIWQDTSNRNLRLLIQDKPKE